MYVLIDNYDSFTYNLWHYLRELGAELVVHRNDTVSVDEVLAAGPEGIIISPGPCTPDEAGICLELVARAPRDLAILGVCLGHQAIAQAHGGKIVRARELMHGKVGRVEHDGHDVFSGLPSPFMATRYHSLTVERSSLPACFEITAQSPDGVIMGICHKDRPRYGVQFHPESIASEHGHALLENFLKLAGTRSSAEDVTA